VEGAKDQGPGNEGQPGYSHVDGVVKLAPVFYGLHPKPVGAMESRGSGEMEHHVSSRLIILHKIPDRSVATSGSYSQGLIELHPRPPLVGPEGVVSGSQGIEVRSH